MSNSVKYLLCLSPLLKSVVNLQNWSFYHALGVSESAGEDEDQEVEEVPLTNMDLDVERGCMGPTVAEHRPSTCLATEKPKPLAKNVKVIEFDK